MLESVAANVISYLFIMGIGYIARKVYTFLSKEK